jgi:DNA-binding NtrC family response regulator
MPSCKVLVVESQDEIRQLLAATDGERCEVEATRSFAAAGHALAADYHVVIIDPDLPDADGLALAQRARGRGSTVILLPRQPHQFASAARRGFYVLARPIDARRLLELIDRALTRIST